jgi:hypothetical protein
MELIASLLGASSVGGVLGSILTRRHALKDQRIGSYKAVVGALSALRSAGQQLADGFDYNQEPRHQDFAPTNEAIRRAYDVIEQQRPETGSAFADAAKFVVRFWDEETDLLWERDYENGAMPRLPEREEAMYNKIPAKYRSRVAPGIFAERVEAAAAPRKILGTGTD